MPADAVLVMHPWHPGVRGSGMGVQGNQLMPLLDHVLYVDSPQIHNRFLPDLRVRLDESFAFWEGRRWADKSNVQTQPFDPDQALQAMRTRIVPRSLAVLTLSSHAASAARLQAAGAAMLAEENGVALWLLPALVEAAGN